MVVKIEITGEGLSYGGETTLPKAAQIIAFINSQTGSPAGTVSVVASQVALPTRESPREALRISGAKTGPQKIGVLGKYIADRNENGGTFSAKELQDMFRRAGEALPANFGRDLGVAVTQGLIASTDTKDEYYITNLAEDLISSQFTGAPKGGRRQASKSPGRKVRLGLSEGVEQLQPTAKFDGLPDYWGSKLKDSKSDRIVWLLAFAKESGLEEISAADIEYLSTRLGDQIGSNTVPSKSIGLIKKSYITKTPAGKFRVLNPGLEFLSQAKE